MNKEDMIISLLKEIDENIDNVNDSEGTNANLEELTITSNGEYVPAEGVDGFSKVTANVVPTKRVVIPNMRVTDALIIDGYWAGELVDTSKVTNISNMFNGCSQLQTLDVSNWDVSSVTNMAYMFYNCSQLQQLDVSDWDVSNITSMYNMFYNCSQLQQLEVSNWDVSSVTDMGFIFRQCSQLQQLEVSNWDVSSVTNMSYIFGSCSQLQSLDVSDWDTSNVTNMANAFRGCSQLQQLDVSNWDVSNVTNISEMFSGCTALKTLIGGRTIEDVLLNNISCLNGLKVSNKYLLYDCNNLDRASLHALINGLADLTGSDTQTLTLGETLIAKLTEEDIAIATEKNWTLS